MPGNPFSPSTPSLHSPAGAPSGSSSSGGGLSRQASGGDVPPSPLPAQRPAPPAKLPDPPAPEDPLAKADPRAGQPAEADPPPPPGQCPASHSSLTERHKILHRLLQDSSPSEPADAARKDPQPKRESPASPGPGAGARDAPSAGGEQHQDHQLLRFLLDTDEKDLENLPPPATLSLHTIRVKTERKGSTETPCSSLGSPKASERPANPVLLPLLPPVCLSTASLLPPSASVLPLYCPLSCPCLSLYCPLSL